MTLGELLFALGACDPNARITTLAGQSPMSFVSYRLVPSEAALTSRPYTDRTVHEVIVELEAALVRLTTGYAYLGCYRFTRETRVWLANQGSCLQQGIGRVINRGSEVILEPCHQEIIE